MNIAVVGTGYVGLTVGACLAETGNDVICIDIDEAKIAALKEGRLPIYEPGLSELVVNNQQQGRLSFSCQLAEAVKKSFIVFVAVGTPPGENGRPDLSQIETVARAVIENMSHYRIVVIKSTVPVGTNQRLTEQLSQLTDTPFDIVSNPEFLKEGYALEDFLRPDRVVIGTGSAHAASIMEELYAPFVRSGNPIIVMDPASSEMTKYAANAMLSTKISFINEVANLCELFGGDIELVRQGICSDRRIGRQFLYPGLGYGGSCFPKDIMALVSMCDDTGYPGTLLRAVHEVNEHQKCRLQDKVKGHFGDDLTGRKIAIWGLSFKPRTDDIREAPSLGLIADLLACGGSISVHDPQAMENVRNVFGDRITYCQDKYEALDAADALCVVTEWNEYRHPNHDQILEAMQSPVVFDGRNVYDPEKMASRGFTYFGIGRK